MIARRGASSRVYDQYGRGTTPTSAPAPRDRCELATRLVRTFSSSDDPAAPRAGAVAIVAAVIVRRRKGSRASNRDRPRPRPCSRPWFPIACGSSSALLVVLTESPMWRNHVAHVAAPVRAARGRRSRRQHDDERFVAVDRRRWRSWRRRGASCTSASCSGRRRHTGEHARLERTAPALRRRRAGHQRHPGARLAGRDSARPDRYVDVSILRITSTDPASDSGRGRRRATPRRPDVCAVVRGPAMRFGSFPGLGRRAGAGRLRGAPAAHPPRIPSGVKRQCDPSGRSAAPHAPAQPVEPAQRRHPFDHPAERHELRRQVERDEHDEARRCRVVREHSSTTTRPSTPPSTFAPVSPSITRSCRSSGQHAERRRP